MWGSGGGVACAVDNHAASSTRQVSWVNWLCLPKWPDAHPKHTPNHLWCFPQVWGITGASCGGGRVRPGGNVTLAPRPINLKEYKSAAFVGVRSAPPAPPAAFSSGGSSSASSNGGVYALTTSGVLVLMRPGNRAIEKSVNLQVKAAFGLAVSQGLVACCCAAGVVRLFATRTLAFKTNLPRPSPTLAAAQRTGASPMAAGLHESTVGSLLKITSPGQGVGAGEGSPGALAAAQAGDIFPDALQAAFDGSGEQLAVLYSGGAMIVYDVRNLSKVGGISGAMVGISCAALMSKKMMNSSCPWRLSRE